MAGEQHTLDLRRMCCWIATSETTKPRDRTERQRVIPRTWRERRAARRRIKPRAQRRPWSCFTASRSGRSFWPGDRSRDQGERLKIWVNPECRSAQDGRSPRVARRIIIGVTQWYTRRAVASSMFCNFFVCPQKATRNAGDVRVWSSISGGDMAAWRKKKKSRPEGRLSKIPCKSEGYLVAGIGFEPMTFRL
jgi:hypothetical protein